MIYAALHLQLSGKYVVNIIQIPYGKKFWREENLADLADFAKIRQIKFPPNLIETTIRQIKFPPNLVETTIRQNFT